jgi:hypothetical protein
MYAAKRFSCGLGAERRDPTKQFYTRMFFYDPVVLWLSPVITATEKLLQPAVQGDE